MDPQSILTYRAAGYTHFVERLQADGLTPEFHKVVKANPDGKGFVDENGKVYDAAKALPGDDKAKSKSSSS